jgi:hypothetical protein
VPSESTAGPLPPFKYPTGEAAHRWYPSPGAPSGGWGASGPSAAATSRLHTGELHAAAGARTRGERRVPCPACSATARATRRAGPGRQWEPRPRPVLGRCRRGFCGGTRGRGGSPVTRRRQVSGAGGAAACGANSGEWTRLEDHAFGRSRSCIACTGAAKPPSSHAIEMPSSESRESGFTCLSYSRQSVISFFLTRQKIYYFY